jgi:hypothetical protein
LPHEDFGDQATQPSSRHARAGGRAAAGNSVMRKVPPHARRAWLVLIRCPASPRTFPGRRGNHLEAKQLRAAGSGGTPVRTPRIGDERTCLALCREEKAVRIRRQRGGFLTGAVAAGPANRSRRRSAPRATSGSGVESRDRARPRGCPSSRCTADRPRRRSLDRRHTRRPPGYSRHTPPLA